MMELVFFFSTLTSQTIQDVLRTLKVLTESKMGPTRVGFFIIYGTLVGKFRPFWDYPYVSGKP